MVKIFIDPGHGGVDSGATGNGLLEKNITLQLGLAIRKYLNQYENTTVNMSRTTDKTVSLSERTNQANRWGADYFLSIHINSGGGTGFESYIFQGLSGAGRTAKIRDDIHDHVIKVNELRDRGEKQANFHVLRETVMPACLTENGFIDSKSDAAKMRQQSWINKVAKAHAEGIADAFSLKGSKTKPLQESGNYQVEKAIPGYYTSLDAKSHTDPRTTVEKGTYYIFSRSDGMINVTKEKGTPGSWINPQDNQIKSKTKYPLPDGILKQGNRGKAVEQLQRALNAANFKVGAVDGIYGPKTEDAVRRFQMVHDAYHVDGIYGPRTKTRLEKVLK